MYCNTYFFAKYKYQLHSLTHFHCECGSEGLRLLASMGSINMVLSQVLGFTVLPPLQSARTGLPPPLLLQSFSWDGGGEDRMTALFHQLSLVPSAVSGCGKTLCFSHLQHVLCLTHVHAGKHSCIEG